MKPRPAGPGLDETCAELRELLAAGLFRALGDPNRVRLIIALAGRCRECSVSELAECLTVDLSVVSRHLALLRDAGVLRATRAGRETRYSIEHQSLARILRAAADAIDRCCPAGGGASRACCETSTQDSPLKAGRADSRRARTRAPLHKEPRS